MPESAAISRQLHHSLGHDHLIDVFSGQGKVLFGTARLQKEQEETRLDQLERIAWRRRKFELDRSVSELKSQAQDAERGLAAKQLEAELLVEEEAARGVAKSKGHDERMRARRQVDDQQRRSPRTRKPVKK
jgi:circadian clock protein KaiC